MSVPAWRTIVVEARERSFACANITRTLDVEDFAAHCHTFSMFSDAVLDHFRNPRNAGELPSADAMVEVSNPVCGDILHLAVRMEGGRIAEARFLCRGCTTAIACASLLTEQLRGKTLPEFGAITPESLSVALGGLPSATFHGAQLAADAVQAVVKRLSSTAG